MHYTFYIPQFPDMFLAQMGTSLVVQPANQLPTRCLARRVPVVVINPHGSTFIDPYAALLLRVPAAALMSDIAV